MAINLVAFPVAELPLPVLSQILRGGADEAREAGIQILGRHSIDDPEPKYGLAVVGTVHPERVVRNRGGRPGDRLVLTKPLGTGTISTALKHGVAPDWAQAAAVASVLRLNSAAAQVMAHAAGVHATTDLTGFGLLGHLHFLPKALQLAARVTAAVPLLPGAEELADAGEVPGGTGANERFLRPWVQWSSSVGAARRRVLADAQTSGGLLIAVSRGDALQLEGGLRANSVDAEIIGELTSGIPGKINVTRQNGEAPPGAGPAPTGPATRHAGSP